MHGELVPVELETGMLEVRKMMGTTEHARQCHNVTVSKGLKNDGMQNAEYDI